VPKPLGSSNMTPATVFRIVDHWHPTMLIDEMDRRIDERIAAEYDASAAGQAKRHQQEIIEAFTRASNRLPQDPPPFVPSGDGYGTWRGQKLPGPLWRGKPIR
jgi:hypothetical protein